MHRLPRRQLVLAIPLLGLTRWAHGSSTPAAAPRRQSRAMMGTRIDLVADIADDALWAEASTAAWAEMARLEAMLSRYQPHSIVSRINAAAGQQAIRAPEDAMQVLSDAKRISALSEGAFDVTVGAMKAWRFDGQPGRLPDTSELEQQRRLIGDGDLVLDRRARMVSLRRAGMALDLGGIAKLPILDAGLNVLKRHGIRNALVNGGGDVLVSGTVQGRPWKVGLRDPRAPERLIGTLALSGQAVVASSGDYERFFLVDGQKMHHILDPRTGRPTRGTHGVSLLADSVEQVNGLGAALMVMGLERGRALLGRQSGVEGLMAAGDQTLWLSDGMARKLAA